MDSSINQTSQPQQSGDMFQQIETIMSTIKREAGALETLKSQIQEVEDLRKQVTEYQTHIKELSAEKEQMLIIQNEFEISNLQLKKDLQHLNNVCNEERRTLSDIQKINTTLKQEINQLHNDLSQLNQNTVEVTKANQILTSQLTQIQFSFEDEKQSIQSTLRALEAQLTESEKQKSEISGHFWRLTEEMNSMKTQTQRKDELLEGKEQQLALVQTQLEASEGRCEDFEKELRASNSVKEELNSELARMMSSSQMQIHQLRQLIQDQEGKITSSDTILNDIKESKQREIDELLVKVNDLTSKLSTAVERIQVSEKEKETAIKKLGTMSSSHSTMQSEIEKFSRLNQELQVTVSGLQTRLSDTEVLVVTTQTQRDEISSQLSSLSSRYTALETQARDEQNWHWTELQRVKNLEMQVTDENSRLLSELEERCGQLDAAQKEKETVSGNARQEIERAASITSALRDELEKRLDELTSATKERDELRIECEELRKTCMALKKQLTASEEAYLKARETDTNKIQQELRTRVAKIRTLESDKEDLLRETSALMQQKSELQKGNTSLQSSLKDISSTLEETRVSLQRAETACQEKASMLEDVRRRETELRNQISKGDNAQKDEIAKLENIVKTTKKVAAQQVTEVSLRVKSVMDEAEAVKTRNKELIEAERKALQEAEKMRSELQLNKSTHAEIQQQMAYDVSLLRREVQDARAQCHTALESKERAEADAIAARLSTTRLESENARLGEGNVDLIQRLEQSEQSLIRIKADHEAHLGEVVRLRNRQTELDSTVARQADKISALSTALSTAGVEDKNENVRLRQQLEVLSSDINQSKAVIQRLQREADEAKSAYARIQTTSNVTVTGLLAELKATETALSEERRRCLEETTAYQEETHRLRQNLESTKTNLEDSRIRGRRDREERDVQIAQLELDIEKSRGSVAGKDARLSELESQRQKDREKLHELLERVAVAEQSRAELEMALHEERQQRRKLERDGNAAGASNMHINTFGSSLDDGGVLWDDGKNVLITAVPQPQSQSMGQFEWIETQRQHPKMEPIERSPLSTTTTTTSLSSQAYPSSFKNKDSESSSPAFNSLQQDSKKFPSEGILTNNNNNNVIPERNVKFSTTIVDYDLNGSRSNLPPKYDDREDDDDEDQNQDQDDNVAITLRNPEVNRPRPPVLPPDEEDEDDDGYYNRSSRLQHVDDVGTDAAAATAVQASIQRTQAFLMRRSGSHSDDIAVNEKHTKSMRRDKNKTEFAPRQTSSAEAAVTESYTGAAAGGVGIGIDGRRSAEEKSPHTDISAEIAKRKANKKGLAKEGGPQASKSQTTLRGTSDISLPLIPTAQHRTNKGR
eukprot:gene5892-11899_t